MGLTIKGRKRTLLFILLVWLAGLSFFVPVPESHAVDMDTLKYNEEKKAQDIATYGLVSYEEYGLIPEYTFNAFNTQYVKIALGKGLLDWEENLRRIEHYMQFIH